MDTSCGTGYDWILIMSNDDEVRIKRIVNNDEDITFDTFMVTMVFVDLLFELMVSDEFRCVTTIVINYHHIFQSSPLPLCKRSSSLVKWFTNLDRWSVIDSNGKVGKRRIS